MSSFMTIVESYSIHASAACAVATAVSHIIKQQSEAHATLYTAVLDTSIKRAARLLLCLSYSKYKNS